MRAARHSEPGSPLATPACCAKMRPMPFRPSRRGLVPPFIAMDVLRAANEREAAGHSVIHLEVGQPGTPAPEIVLDAARRALAKDRIGYTDALGIAPLREAIARHYREQYGIAVEPADIVVTTGSSAAFQLAFLAAFEPGDRVALAAPGYPAYRNILSTLDLEPVLIEVGENAHYQPNPELLAEAGELAGLIVASPANPTGTMIPAADLERLTEYCRERDGHVARYRANRDRLIAMLRDAGLTRFAPAEGAFYLYVDVSALTRDSVEFCRRLLAETGVAVTPGCDFDPIHGDSWIRLSFAGSTEDIAEACGRLQAWLPQQPGA